MVAYGEILQDARRSPACDLCRESATPYISIDLLCPVKWLMASCHQGNFEAYAGLFRFHCANASWSLVHRGPAGATPGASSTPFTWHHQSGNCASALFKHTNKQVATQPTAAVMVGCVGAVGEDGGVGEGGGGGGRSHPEVQLQGTRILILQFSILNIYE